MFSKLNYFFIMKLFFWEYNLIFIVVLINHIFDHPMKIYFLKNLMLKNAIIHMQFLK